MSYPTIRQLTRQRLVEAGLRPGTHPENVAALMLHRAGHTFEQQFRVGPYRLDFAFPRYLIDLEVDGWHHHRPESAAKDSERDCYLRTHGWLVLRVNDGDQLKDQVARVSQVIHFHIDHRWRP